MWIRLIGSTTICDYTLWKGKSATNLTSDVVLAKLGVADEWVLSSNKGFCHHLCDGFNRFARITLLSGRGEEESGVNVLFASLSLFQTQGNMNDSFFHLIDTELVHHLALSCHSEARARFVFEAATVLPPSLQSSSRLPRRREEHIRTLNNCSVTDLAFTAWRVSVCHASLCAVPWILKYLCVNPQHQWARFSSG